MNALRSGGLHINCPFAEPLYGEMNDTGLVWQQQLGDWWESEKPWLLEQTHLESAKTARLVLLASEARRGDSRADECGGR